MTRITKVDIVVATSSAERSQRRNLSHHTRQNVAALGIDVGLVHGFEQLFLEGGPVFASLLHIGSIELDVLITEVADSQAAGISADSIRHELLVLLIGAHGADFGGAHNLDDLIALGHRFQKFRAGNARKPVFLVHAGQDKVTVPDAGKRSRFNSRVTAGGREKSHKVTP